MTYRGYVTGLNHEAPPGVALRALHADDQALAACMDAWPGKLAIRPGRDRPGVRFIQVEEGTLLDQCLQVRDWFRLELDETGTVTRVVTPPQNLPELPCIMATACGYRFAGLGAGLTF